MQDPRTQYILMLADNALILGQRMSEWVGHAPELELDMAAGNLALDHIGQAKLLFEHLAAQDGETRTADEIAMMRDVLDYTNCRLVEQPNEDWGQTVLRHFLFCSFQRLQYLGLSTFPDREIAAIAAKSVKELNYHIRFARTWVLRLGDGTEESHAIMQAALGRLWRLSGELFTPSEAEQTLIKNGDIKSLDSIHTEWTGEIMPVLREAGLEPQDDVTMVLGGKQGQHSEYLGHLLSDLQYMQRAFPGAQW